jgi:hypothetical protein
MNAIYLEDVATDGTCRYVTEGMLRAASQGTCAAGGITKSSARITRIRAPMPHRWCRATS